MIWILVLSFAGSAVYSFQDTQNGSDAGRKTDAERVSRDGLMNQRPIWELRMGDVPPQGWGTPCPKQAAARLVWGKQNWLQCECEITIIY